MQRILLLALIVFPLVSQADIGIIDIPTEGLQEVRATGNTMQTLGDRLHGNGVSLEVYIKSNSTNWLHVSLTACEDADADPKTNPECAQMLLGQLVSNTSGVFKKQEYKIDHEFDPEKYYFLSFDHFSVGGSGTGGVALGGSIESMYSRGSCHSSGNGSDCKIVNSSDLASDFAFQITGVDILPIVLPENPPADTPIIFLPGIFGSRLYHGEEKIWDGLAGERMRELVLNENGKSINDIKVGSVLHNFEIAGIGTKDVYNSLAEHFDCLGTFSSSFVRNIPGNESNCGAPLVSYPYDWRYDVFDILDAGTNYTSGENIKLIDLVEHLSNNPTGKVHLVAHSNGGLLAKALMVRLEEQGKENLVDKIVLVGSPQLGTPSAVGAMLHGHGQQKTLGLVKRDDISRTLSLNTPGIYSLLPSQEFIENNGPVIEFDSSPYSNKYRNAFGQFIDSYGEFVTFLTDPTNLCTRPEEDDLNAPAILNERLLKKAQETHKKIDEWKPTEGVEFVQIIGIDNPTVKRYKYSTGLEFKTKNIGSLKPVPNLKLWYRPVTTIDGDSEVIAEASETGIGKIYYAELKGIDDYLDRKISHGELLVEPEILKSIEEIFDAMLPTSAYLAQTRESDIKEKSPLYTIISVHSPVTISVTDNKGNVSGLTYNTSTDFFQTIEDIPNSFIEFVGEAKYVYLPSGTYDVEVTGIDTGSFDLALSQTNEDGEIEEIQRFKHIPTKESAGAEVSVNDNTFGVLTVDIDNDSTIDHTFSLGESSSSIRNELKYSMTTLSIRPQLASAISQYFDLLETAKNKEEKANYVAQIKRIIRFLNDRYITKDTANTWTALAEHLQ